MAGRGRLERQRERVRELLRSDAARSNRSIAAELGCSHHTVARVREQMPGRAPQADGPGSGQHPGSENLMEPAGPGNLRASTHGAYSAARRAPLEEMHRDRLRLAYPSAPDDLINSAAKRLAMADLFSSWIADVGLIHNRGNLPVVSDAAKELRLLLRDHEAAVATLGELERPDPVATAYARVQRLQEGRADGD